MSAIDPAEARFHADDPPGATLPSASVLVGALAVSALLWLGGLALLGALLARLHV